jgi:hypothetical protein
VFIEAVIDCFEDLRNVVHVIRGINKFSLFDYGPPRSVMDPKGKPKEGIEIRVGVLEAGCFAKPLIAMPYTDRRSYPGAVASGS